MTLTAKEDIEDRRLWVGISIRKPQQWARKSIRRRDSRLIVRSHRVQGGACRTLGQKSSIESTVAYSDSTQAQEIKSI